MAAPAWSDLLQKYAKKRKLLQADIARELDVWPSAVFGWFRGGKPRDEALLARVEKWSGGAIKADAPARVADVHWRRKRLAASA